MYTQHSLSSSHTQPLKHPVFQCVCTCKHKPPEQKQSEVIKTVSLAASSQFLFEVTGSKGRRPCVPHAFLPPFPPPSVPPPLCLSVTLPDARWVGLPCTTGHRATEIPQHAKHLGYVLCVSGCLGVSTRQPFKRKGMWQWHLHTSLKLLSDHVAPLYIGKTD